jgi:hypothetical protein
MYVCIFLNVIYIYYKYIYIEHAPLLSVVLHAELHFIYIYSLVLMLFITY